MKKAVFKITQTYLPLFTYTPISWLARFFMILFVITLMF